MSRFFRFQAVVLPLICLLLGAFLSILAWGRSSDDRMFLENQLKRFRSLSREQQDNVRKSHVLFHSQSPKRRAEIEEIFHETRQNAELKNTLDQYFTWWSGLSQNQWDTFRELSPDDRLQFVQEHWTDASRATEEITVEFTGPPTARMPTLHLTFEEYWTIISAVIPASRRDAALTAEIEQLASNKHRALRLTLWLFESFQNQTEIPGGEARSEFFTKAMLDNIHDEAWSGKFQKMTEDIGRKPFARSWQFMTLFRILEQATIALGDDLRRQFPVTADQIVEAFSSLPEEEKTFQRSLMTMSSEEARKRLELLAQTAGARTPEELLLTQYNRFTKNRKAYSRSPFRVGTSGFGSERLRPPAPPQKLPRELGRKAPVE